MIIANPGYVLRSTQPARRLRPTPRKARVREWGNGAHISCITPTSHQETTMAHSAAYIVTYEIYSTIDDEDFQVGSGEHIAVATNAAEACRATEWFVVNHDPQADPYCKPRVVTEVVDTMTFEELEGAVA